MDDFERRQIALMRQFVEDFKRGEVSLNILIQQIEAVIAALGSEEFAARADAFILDLEVINATLLDEDRGPTDDENQAVSEAISGFEGLLS